MISVRICRSVAVSDPVTILMSSLLVIYSMKLV